MRKIAAEQHVACPWQLDQQDVMARRMPRLVQHHHGAIAEHILVKQHGFDRAAPADPIHKRLGIHYVAWWATNCWWELRAGQDVPIALADQDASPSETSSPGRRGRRDSD